MAGKRGALAGAAFHEIAVPANGEDFEVKEFEAGLVEICSEPFAGDCHSNAIPCALPEGAGGGFNAGGDVGFGMARSFAADLAEALDFVHGNGKRVQDFAVFSGFFHACKMKSGIEEHGSVAGRENETVAIGPSGIGGIVP